MPRRPQQSAADLLDEDLTEIDDRDLIDMLTLLTRWADLANIETAFADIDYSAAKAIVARLTDIGLIRAYDAGDVDDDDAPKRKVTVTETKARLRMDKEISDAQQRELDTFAYRRLVTAQYENYQRDAAVVSRELTRRTERDPSVRRQARHGGAR